MSCRGEDAREYAAAHSPARAARCSNGPATSARSPGPGSSRLAGVRDVCRPRDLRSSVQRTAAHRGRQERCCVRSPGPAGRLEALLDEPRRAPRERRRTARTRPGGMLRARWCSRIRTRSTAARCTRRSCISRRRRWPRIGCAVLRFNFRGVGRSAGAFDDGPGEKDDFRAGLDFMHDALSGRAALGGAACRSERGSRCRSAPTIRACRRSSASRRRSRATTSTRCADSTKPKFFIQGERDEICPLKDMREFYARAAEPKELVVIDGGESPVRRQGQRGRRGDRGLCSAIGPPERTLCGLTRSQR